MKKRFALALSMVMMVLAVAGCGPSKSPAASSNPGGSSEPAVQPSGTQTPITIKFGKGAAEASYFGQSLRYLEELVNERMAGEVVFELYMGEQLGNASAMLENLQVDLQQGWGDSLDTLAIYTPDLNIYTMAYAFKDMDHVNAFLASEVGTQIFDKLEREFNIVVTDYNFDRLPRGYISTKPIANASDMKGLKWRIPNIEIFEKNAAALGAVPTFVAWSEYPYALMQGVVDAGDSSYEDIVPNGFHLSAPYISLTGYCQAKNCVVLNTQTWNKMTPEQQQTWTECVNEASAWFRDTVNASWETDQQTILESGAQFVEIDRDSFINGVSGLAAELEAEHFWETAGLYEYVQNLEY